MCEKNEQDRSVDGFMIFYTLRLMEWNNVTNGHNSYFIPLLLLYCVREKMEKTKKRKRGSQMTFGQRKKPSPFTFRVSYAAPVAIVYVFHERF